MSAIDQWRRVLRRRGILAAVVMGLWGCGLVARLVQLQVYRHAELVQRAARQQQRAIMTAPQRGVIVDRRGEVLARSVDADSIYAVPTEIDDAPAAARALCEALGDCRPGEAGEIVQRLERGRAFAWVRRKVSPEQSSQVRTLHLDGIGFLKESRRFYPKLQTAAHVLGYVGLDNEGLGGVEYAYDRQIRGHPGSILVQTDARRRAFGRAERPSTGGASIELTLDEVIQHIAEHELRDGAAEHQAAGGSVIVMDPWTGEILAMANEPTFNPNVYLEATGEARRNRAVMNLYEPGSTFKIVTASAALQEHVLAPDDPVDCGGGLIRLGKRVVTDVHRYGMLPFADVIVKSSNVGAIRIGLRVGAARLGAYVRRYGFGRPTSPDFPGESAGMLSDAARWSESALASVSMGYQIGVTPLQMVTAVSSIANGGALLQPRVVRAVIANGHRVETRPHVVRRTIATTTIEALRSMMESVVERGTARAAQIPGFTVAGKTGTAAKLENGRYSRTDYNASFVGFVPSRAPVVAIIVVVDSPRGAYFGGSVAAPIFRRIAEHTLAYYGVRPASAAPPPLVVARAEVASEPAAPPAMAVSPPSVASREDLVPDLRGMGAREAAARLAARGLVPRIEGSGVVATQDPAPGSILEPGAICRVVLARHSVGAAVVPASTQPATETPP